MFMSQEAEAQEGDRKDWDRIIEQAAQTNPICKNWLQQLSLYVRRCPTSGEILQDLNTSSQIFKASHHGVKVIGEEFFIKLNSLSWGKFEKFPLVENSFLKAQLAGDNVTDNICKTIPSGALNYAKSEKMRPVVKASEKLMSDARDLVSKLGVDPDVSLPHVCMLDVRLALLVAGKQGAFGKTLATVEEVAQD